MILVICVKEVQSANGGKFNRYSTKRGDQWYNVKFTKTAPQLKTVNIGKDERHPIVRGFINVEPENIDISENKFGKLIWVSDFNYDGAREAVEEEKKRIEEYRKKREEEKLNFFSSIDPPLEEDMSAKKTLEPADEDCPF